MHFFWNKRFGFRNNEVREVNACVIQADTRDMLRQMCLPLIPERRVKGALSHVSRETGLPFSKIRRLYYGITDHVLAFEWSAIHHAYDAWLKRREQIMAHDLEQIRALQTARLQGRINFDSASNPPRPDLRDVAEAETLD